jgi:hypothetical protein
MSFGIEIAVHFYDESFLVGLSQIQTESRESPSGELETPSFKRNQPWPKEIKPSMPPAPY